MRSNFPHSYKLRGKDIIIDAEGDGRGFDNVVFVTLWEYSDIGAHVIPARIRAHSWVGRDGTERLISLGPGKLPNGRGPARFNPVTGVRRRLWHSAFCALQEFAWRCDNYCLKPCVPQYFLQLHNNAVIDLLPEPSVVQIICGCTPNAPLDHRLVRRADQRDSFLQEPVGRHGIAKGWKFVLVAKY